MPIRQDRVGYCSFHPACLPPLAVVSRRSSRLRVIRFRNGGLPSSNHALPVPPVSFVTRECAIITAFMPVVGLVWFTSFPCTINLQHTGALGFAIGCDLIPGREQLPCIERLEPMPVQSDLACVLWCGANKTKSQFLQKGYGTLGTIVRPWTRGRKPVSSCRGQGLFQIGIFQAHGQINVVNVVPGHVARHQQTAFEEQSIAKGGETNCQTLRGGDLGGFHLHGTGSDGGILSHPRHDTIQMSQDQMGPAYPCRDPSGQCFQPVQHLVEPMFQVRHVVISIMGCAVSCP